MSLNSCRVEFAGDSTKSSSDSAALAGHSGSAIVKWSLACSVYMATYAGLSMRTRSAMYAAGQ